MSSSDKAQELLHKYSLEALGESLLAYVTKARAALGPPLLKVFDLTEAIFLIATEASFQQSLHCSMQVLESDVATGRYMPYMTGAGERLLVAQTLNKHS